MTVTLTNRERAALDAIRAALALPSDEQAVLAGLYKLAQWVSRDADPHLFRLSRKHALRTEQGPVEKSGVDKPDPA